MKLSPLQKYILRASLGKGRVDKDSFFKFYQNRKSKPRDIENVIIKSLNRLINKDLIIAFCHKTKAKIFIEKISLTAPGRKIARGLLGTQKKLPIKYRKQINKKIPPLRQKKINPSTSSGPSAKNK